MFEQESYDKATVETASQPDGGLFRHYEIKNWEFSPLIYKILAASAILHIAVFVFIAQTNVLAMRGCDSPWVGRVCQVVDMTYLGALLYGTDREYADVAYDRTELGPEDEITYIVVSDDKLEYPEGYFHLANPEQFIENATPGDLALNPPGIPAYPPLGSGGTDLLKVQPNLPPPAPNAYQDDSSSLLKVEGTPSADAGQPRSPRNRRNRRPLIPEKNEPGPTDVANSNTGPKAEPANPVPPDAEEAKADENGIFINKRPLKDRAKETLAQIDAQQLKLDKPFKVVITGTLGLAKDGKTVVLKDPKPVPVDPNIPNDPAMVKLAQDWILAVGDAGWLGYLEMLDPKKKPNSKKVTITVEQNDTNFTASIRSDLTSPNEANTMATSLRNLITLGAIGAKDDELEFLKAATTASDGNSLVLNLNFEKPIVQQMIQRKLAEAKAAPAEPSSTAVNSATNKTASK